MELAETALTGPLHNLTRIDEVAALPSPAVLLSARLDRYYDRLRRPPGPRPLPGDHPVIGRAASGSTCPQAAGPGRASPVPAATIRTFRAPYAEEFLAAAIQELHRFHGLHPDLEGLGSPWYRPLGRLSNDAAGFASCYGPLSCSPLQGL